MTNEKRLIDVNKLRGLKYEKVKFSDYREGWNDAIDTICTETFLPSVDAAEVVHGHWIDDGGLDEDGNGQYRCSHCGVGEKHNPTVPVSYCWNCGAKMDGDGNG